MVRMPEAGRRGALALKRRADERILITGGISIEVVRVEGEKVRLLVSAPGGIEIWREEIAPADFLARERRAA